jgi:hypothetical protein
MIFSAFFAASALKNRTGFMETVGLLGLVGAQRDISDTENVTPVNPDRKKE